MVLRRKSYKSNRISKAWNKIKSFGTKLLVGGLFIGSVAPTMAGCSETKQEQPNQNETDLLITPPSTNVIQDEDGNFYMADRIVVGVTEIDNNRVLSITRRYNGRITVRVPGTNLYEIEVDGDIDRIITEIQGNGFVRFAERNYFFRSAGKTYEGCSTPPEEVECSKELDNDCLIENDELWAESLWWHEKIQLSKAYKLLRERGIELPEVTVAVLDTSFQLNNPELRDRFVDSRYHLNAANPGLFGENKTNVSPTNASWNGDARHAVHGTAVSSIIAAENNGSKMNGVAFNAKILPIKFESEHFQDSIIHLGQVFFGDAARLGAALVHIAEKAEELNIVAVNISGSILFTNRAMDYSISYFPENVIIISAAGNESQNLIGRPPASYSRVIGVAGTEIDQRIGEEQRWVEEGQFFRGSNYHEYIEIAAPAREVLSVSKTAKDREEECVSKHAGTSFSAAMVSGLVALMKSINPELTHDQVVDILTKEGNYDPILLSDDQRPELRNKTWKRINVYKTLRALLQDESCKRISRVRFSDFTLGDGKIVFYNWNPSRVEIFVYKIEDGSVEEGPEECDINSLPIFKDAKLICQTRNGDATSPEGVIVKDLETGSTYHLRYTEYLEDRRFFYPRDYSLSGNRFVFSNESQGINDQVGLHLVNLDTGEVEFLGSGINPSISGDNLAYVTYSGQYGKDRIRLLSLVSRLDYGIGVSMGSDSYGNPTNRPSFPLISSRHVLFRNSEESEDIGDTQYILRSLQVVDTNDPTQPVATQVVRELEPQGPGQEFSNELLHYGISGSYLAYLTGDNKKVVLYHIPTGETNILFEGDVVAFALTDGFSSVQIEGRNVVFIEEVEGVNNLVLCDF